jgi:hypothetical protein
VRLGDRFRRRFRGFRGRLTIELARVEEPPASPPVEPLVLPAPERPRRPSAGLAALYGARTLSPDPYASGRPRPLGQGPAHDKAIIRDQASAWRDGGPDTTMYQLDRDALHAELFPPTVPWWEQRDQ